MVKVGDIVVRKSRPGVWAVGEPLSASWLFYDGYFLVLSIKIGVVNIADEMISTCLIMNSSGETSWIDKRNIKTVVELKNEK